MSEPMICNHIIDDASAWRGPEMAADRSWICEFTAGEIAELDRALRQVQKAGLPFADVRRRDFELPTLEPKLATHLEEIRAGRGFVVLRGLPVERYSDEEVGLI